MLSQTTNVLRKHRKIMVSRNMGAEPNVREQNVETKNNDIETIKGEETNSFLFINLSKKLL